MLSWLLWYIWFAITCYQHGSLGLLCVSLTALVEIHRQYIYIYIFGKLSPCSFTWSYPGKIFLHKIFEQKRKKQKMYFFAIFRVPPLMKVTARHSDNIDASGLPDSSSESFCPKVFREHVKNVGTFKIGGPSPLQSHLIQIRVAPKSCFWGSFLEKILVLTDFDQMLTPP